MPTFAVKACSEFPQLEDWVANTECSSLFAGEAGKAVEMTLTLRLRALLTFVRPVKLWKETTVDFSLKLLFCFSKYHVCATDYQKYINDWYQ